MNPIIIETIKYFDFERVRVAMEALDMQWSTADGMQVPEIGMIVSKAIELLEELCDYTYNVQAVSCGGLRAEVFENDVDGEKEYHLSFCLEDSACFVDKEGKIF